jgi:valyl-tRNA synthetase
MDEYGTDAFRFTLAAFAAQGRDVKLSENRVEGYRNFVNKIWNASRFTLMNLEDYEEGALNSSDLDLAGRWILSRLNSTVKDVTTNLDTYRFNDAASVLYQFVWHEYCDWYIEMIKPTLYGKEGDDKRRTTQTVLLEVLKTICKLLHPFMPFLTEELYSYLPGENGSVMISSFPEYDASIVDEALEGEMALVMDVIKSVRNIKGEVGIPPSKTVELIIKGGSEASRSCLVRNRKLIDTMAKLAAFDFIDGEAPEGAATSVVGDMEIFIPLKEHVNTEEEANRLLKEISKVDKDLEFLLKKLANKNFVEKAPKEVVKKDTNRCGELKSIKSKLEESLDRLKCLN